VGVRTWFGLVRLPERVAWWLLSTGEPGLLAVVAFGQVKDVEQQAHVIDAVRPCSHARDQALRLRDGTGPARAAGTNAGQQLRQSRTAGEGQERRQAGVGQLVRVIEHGARPREARNNLTREVSSRKGRWKRSELPSSQFRGHLLI